IKERQREGNHNQYNEIHFAACVLVTSLPSSTGMLKRTKYSRLRNDSLTSLEERPQPMMPAKMDVCLNSEIAHLDSGMPSHHGPSTLREFIPRVANIRLQSPISLLSLRGQTNAAGDRAIDEHIDRPSCGAEWGSGPSHRLCSQQSLVCTGMNNWCFVVLSKYMGSVEVTQSMRTLDFDTRIQVTRYNIPLL
uniref:Uncharacterized protein n=1 Tax=Mastacembelus armatus TaxID=205130 RepID=A0A7N8Y2I2_9TELE